MFSFKEKFSSIKSEIAVAVESAKEKVDSSYSNHIAPVVSKVGCAASETFDAGKCKVIECCEKGADVVVEKFNNTFEVDKDASEIVEGIRGRLPIPVSDVEGIFEQCKKEALQRAISAFCLGPIMHGLDRKLEARYDNLSDSYQEFDSKHGVRRHDNYRSMQGERQSARDGMMYLDDGYNSSNILDPYSADIDHVVSARETYGNILLRAATTNDEIKDMINRDENLVFSDSSFNRSKGSEDLMEFIERNGIPDESDPSIFHVKIGDKDCEINIEDAESVYSAAKRESRKDTINAVATIGATAIESGAKMAVQQVVGLMIYETIDIFVDEIKDISCSSNLFNEDGVKACVAKRSSAIHEKLKLRFEERDIVKRAKTLGIESGVAGALSIIPQILISILMKTPMFVISIIRESTLSAVRCVRILMDKNIDRYDGIKIVMAGTVAAVLGVYIERAISSAISGVPLLNRFNRPVTDVLAGVFVTGIPLAAVYAFDKQKDKFVFTLRKKGLAGAE